MLHVSKCFNAIMLMIFGANCCEHSRFANKVVKYSDQTKLVSSGVKHGGPTCGVLVKHVQGLF